VDSEHHRGPYFQFSRSLDFVRGKEIGMLVNKSALNYSCLEPKKQRRQL
jgi:hypothetical protein